MEPQANRFEGWAVVEMFGHTKEVGFVTTQYYGTACLFQIDVPELPEREFTLQKPEYTTSDNGDMRWTPAGAKVRRSAVPARSRLIGPGSIYSITPCTEDTARRAIEECVRRALILLELPKDKQQPLLPGEENKTVFDLPGLDSQNEEEFEEQEENNS
jgi:hypothetical protein